MSFRITQRNAVLLAVLTVVLMTLGAIEGWYGRLFYSADSMGYLDAASALRQGNWKTAFSPYWGFLYSLLFAALRPLFQKGPFGEWVELRVLSLAVLLTMWISFLALLKAIAESLPQAWSAEDARVCNDRSMLLMTAAFSIFVSFQIGAGNVSRVSADPLVSCVGMWTLNLLLRIMRRPSIRLAVSLGLVLGFGYLTKAILLPFACVVFLFLLCSSKLRPKLAFAAVAFAAIAIPYVLALSWAFGRPSLGETGPLNFAWYVNGLMRSVHWEGGPPEFGAPIHPTHRLIPEAKVFEFAEPFHVTYPPFFDAPYWYEGYKKVFHPGRQLTALAANLRTLSGIVLRNPLSYALAVFLAILFLRSKRKARGAAIKALAQYWLVYLPAIAGIALYLPVHLEERFISGYLCVLSGLLVLIAVRYAGAIPVRMQTGLAAVLLIGLASDLAVRERTMFIRLFRGEDFKTHDDWKIGMALIRDGFRPGDRIGAVNGPMYFAGWAHVAGLHIVSEFAAPEDDPDLFWRLTPELQGRILEGLRRSGARAAIATENVRKSAGAGWQALEGTSGWVYRF